MRIPRAKAVGVGVVVLIGTAAAAMTVAGFDFSLSRFRVPSGGDEFSSGGSFDLRSTVGQAEASAPDALTGGSWSLTGGFRVGSGAAGATCPGDVTGDGVVDVLDIIEVFTFWGPCQGCPADLNGDGIVDVGDLLIVLSDWNCGADDFVTFDETLVQAGLSANDWDAFVAVLDQGADADVTNWLCWMRRALQSLTAESETGPLVDCAGESPLTQLRD